MFTDLVGFTSVAERIGERDVARLLNRYLSRCADVAHAHGATVDKFIGDAVMILLGAPDELPPEEQARRCVALARAMRDALEDTPMQMRAGINTGEVIVGHFGSSARSDFTAVGHAVNLAARLETACEPGRILVGEETARLLESACALEPAGEIRLKGISQPVRAFYVLEEGAGEITARPGG
jgi:adenylate cyclase